MTELSHAVFLSYASQDADAARRICEALRAAGIEVWFDQSALRGGDVWDQTIRKQIKACVLFIPVLSKHTHDRVEGYFRLEWKLAIDRSHLIAPDQTFLLPVAIDNTREDDERVPDKFRDIHWTRLPSGATSPAFVERVRRLVSSPDAPDGPMTEVLKALSPTAIPVARSDARHSPRAKLVLPLITALVLAGALAYVAVETLPHGKRELPPQAVPAIAPAAVAFRPPPHSIAVLPFVNMSGDASQEYFSDGLTEEVLNSLARFNELQVAARTSSFSFKGKDADISTIAHKLNVASVLEGSVRRAGNTIRVTAQLDSAVTGFHLWSQTYDRDLTNVLQLQTDIANSVANALKVTLLGDVAAKVEVGGTRNPAAFDAYLRAARSRRAGNAKDTEAAIAGYTDAIRLDPDYAMAYADRSYAFSDFAGSYAKGSSVRDYLDKAQADGRRAVTIASNLGRGHLALAYAAEAILDFTTASDEYARALPLAPGDAEVLTQYGRFTVFMGQTESGLAALHRAVVLDPLHFGYHDILGQGLLAARRYNDAISAFASGKAVDPSNLWSSQWLGLAYYSIGDFQSARTACESRGDEYMRPYCLALVYDKLGRHTDAESMLAMLRATWGETQATYTAMIYAQWGDTARSLDWLETAMRNRDPSLEEVKTSPWLDPLRKEPRFQAIERELKFPN